MEKIMSTHGIIVYSGNEMYFVKYSVLTISCIEYNMVRQEITQINTILFIVINPFCFFIVFNFDYYPCFEFVMLYGMGFEC